MIHPSIAQLAVSIASLKPDPRNARSHDERNIEAVVESYREHGQRKPIVVQRRTNGDLIIRAGNGQFEAAKRLGWTEIAAVIVDESDKDARKYALRDNRTAELAEWNLANLGAELRDLKAEGVDLESVGWEVFEAEPLMAAEWKPSDKTDEDFQVPDRRVGLMFTRPQWDALKAFLQAKPTAEEVLKRLGITVTHTQPKEGKTDR